MTTYQPISCDTHSRYELLIMQGTKHAWRYRDELGLEQCIHGVAIDLLTRSKEEFIIIQKSDNSTLTVRLDRIINCQ